MEMKIVKKTDIGKKSAELISLKDFDVNKLVVGELEEKTLTNTAIKYASIPIYYETSPGVYSTIYLRLPDKRLTFGISDNIYDKDPKQQTGNVTSYSLPVCIHKNNVKPNDEEAQFLEVFEAISNRYRKFLLSPAGEEMTGKKLAEHQLEDFCTALNYPRMPVDPQKKGGKNQKRPRDPNRAPIMYIKLKTHIDQRTNQFNCQSLFYDEFQMETPTREAFQIYRSNFHINAIIELTNIFCGTNSLFRLQVKLNEAQLFPLKSEVVSFFRNGTEGAPRPAAITECDKKQFGKIVDDDDFDDKSSEKSI